MVKHLSSLTFFREYKSHITYFKFQETKTAPIAIGQEMKRENQITRSREYRNTDRNRNFKNRTSDPNFFL